MRTPNLRRVKTNKSAGFALIVTLMMVALAAIITVTLLTNTTLERGTTSSYHSRLEADIAVQNGLEAAKNVLVASPSVTASATGDDNFLILRADGTQTNANGVKDAYYYLAKVAAGSSTTVDCYPLFTGGTVTQLTIDHSNYPPLQSPTAPTAPATTNAAQDSGGNAYPILLPTQQRPYTQWQEQKDPNDTATGGKHDLPYQRYTYWVEDLGGYLDASIAGNEEGAANAHKRDTGTNGKEVSLFTLFEPTLTADSGTTTAKKLIDNRNLLFTVPTLQQVTGTTGPTDVTQVNMAVRLGIDNGGERNLIPLGFGFKDEGQPKTNLNTVLKQPSATAVTTISDLINKNLPQFATLRKGGFPTATGEDYVKTLAANMIDYADTDSDATVGTGYRGIDSYPFMTEFFNRYNWEGTTNYYAKGNPATWWAKVHLTGYIQLWNMTNKDITSGTLVFTDIDRYGVKCGSNDYKFDDNTFTITFGGGTTLAANAFQVYKLYDKVYEFDSGVTTAANPPSTSNSPIKMGQMGNVTADHNESGYQITWNGKTVDRPGAGTRDGSEPTSAPTGPNTTYANLKYFGLERKAASLQTAQSKLDPSWRGTYPGLRYDTQSEGIFNLGDPRSAYYIGRNQMAVSYAKRPKDGSSGTDGNSSWWGRAYQQNLINPTTPSSTPWVAAETLISNWPDGDHVTTKGNLPADTTKDPLDSTVQSPMPPTESNKAPINISNSGTFTSITELGRVYDPIQWRPSAFPVSGGTSPPKPSSAADVATTWRDAWKNDFVSDSNYGDASTLRIGTPEFKQFDKDDSRAARLMDLFDVADRTDTRGLININTASREVLRTLAAGIDIKSDLAAQPAATFYGPSTSSAGDKFADAVIASRPFLSTSQLAGILTTANDPFSKFFGNPASWSSNAPTEWTDSAREEYFSRMFNLSTVRSRNFRVFVTGQSLDKTGRVLSTTSRVFQLALIPTRDTDGKMTAQHVEVTYEKEL